MWFNLPVTLLTELTWESFSNNILSAGHHFFFTCFHIFGESCHSELGPHCPPLRGRLRGCKEGAAYLLQEPLFFCLFSKRLLFDLLLTLVYRGSRCPGDQTQALVTCHQEAPAISWAALSKFPGREIILTSASNIGEQVEPSPPDSLRIP